ncbi:hypothetical protein THRCLA_05465 [Thraustotheca clavata]|uniref:Dymeclin n=1 Tax=Thraustotheca clavata TaxID=74557 RepID=A0A1V9ZVU7_9STRA|nr:hypothetical protein THRCLA_05465 [Thraustotheca clavata]
MGNASSGDAAPSVLEPAQTSALEKIVSTQAYSMSDPVWATFFTMEQSLVQMPIEKFQIFLRPYMHAIAVNTLVSGNFRMLVRHATKSIPFNARDKMEKQSRNVLGTSLVHVVNVLFVIRHFCLHFIERTSNDNKDIALYFKRSQSSNLQGYLQDDSWRSSKNIQSDVNLPPNSNSNDDDAVVDFIDMLFTILLEQPPT